MVAIEQEQFIKNKWKVSYNIHSLHLKDLGHSKCLVWIIALCLSPLRFGWNNRRTLYNVLRFLRNDIIYPFSLQFMYKTS